MPAPPPRDVRAYLAKVPPPQRAALLKLRAQVLAAAPHATERISYKIPGFAHEGRMLVWMAAFSKHCSFFGGHEAAALARAHGGTTYEVKGSTIRFSPRTGLPTPLVRRILKARLTGHAKRAKGTKRAKGAARACKTAGRQGGARP